MIQYKLKYLESNGYGLLIDDSASFYPEYNDPSNIITISKIGKHYAVDNYWKIIFAAPELNLEGVPLLPDYKEWEVEQLAKQRYGDDMYLFAQQRDGFIEAYKHKKAKYTEEDLGNLWDFCAYNKGSFQEGLQSLQKIPKYIVMESDEKFTCYNCNAGNLSKNNYCKSNCNIHSKLEPKLITNSEGKQEGIIKEIIY